MQTILAQLALDDPRQFGDVDAVAADTPAGLLLELVRNTVHNTLEAVDADLEEEKAKQAVSVVLGQMSAKLAGASAALFRSAVFSEAGSNISPLVSNVPLQQARREYKTYMALLEGLATAIHFTQTSPDRFPMTKQTIKEANFLASVFGFLAEPPTCPSPHGSILLSANGE